ncbi:hypothetical protein H8S23_11710 [Anaerofilum sp. BX8]|uniref:Lipoprotein n=1 Tax=Anaerofilum hominis TaxID=2763016 RepID=A0A923KYL3_9FIRM|nr:hypothetical protein [Anaerofilum hominis]MBC5582174.1 hypothetical protein [Anaerofilum hominis]
MKKFFSFFAVLLLAVSLAACGEPDFDGSRLGNDSQLVMKYKVFNGTDSQQLKLEKGDLLEIQLVNSGEGVLRATVQKDEETPIFEQDDVSIDRTTLEIGESGVYTVTVTGERARGSVSFIKKEKAE